MASPSVHTKKPTTALAAFLLVVLGSSFTALVLARQSLQFSDVSFSWVVESGMPELVPRDALFAIRCAFLMLIIATTVYVIMVRDIQISPTRYPDSKLQAVTIRLCGASNLVAFTMISWVLQGLYFAGALACSALAVHDMVLPTWLGVSVWLSFEVSFSCALLVSFLVTYVLIPEAATQRDPKLLDEAYFNPASLIMHNANIVMMSTELLFNSFPILLTHFPVSVVWGIFYVLLAWCYLWRSGAVLYPFIDPTLPAPKAIGCHFGLLLAIGLFFCAGVGLSNGAQAVGGIPRVLLVYAGTWAVMRTPLSKPEHAPKGELM